MGEIFHEILIRPLFNILVVFYNSFGDFGFAIIALTALVRVILYPLSVKAIRSQKELSLVSPQIQEIQKKYKGDQATQAKELMKLYQEHNINPFSGCLPILIQIPIVIALYQVFFGGLDPTQLETLYRFITRPEVINPTFLNFFDLSKNSIPLALLTGVLQFIQSKMTVPQQQALQGQSSVAIMSKQMLYIFPFMTALIASSLPAGPVLYWFTTTFIAIIQQWLVRPRTLDVLKQSIK